MIKLGAFVGLVVLLLAYEITTAVIMIRKARDEKVDEKLDERACFQTDAPLQWEEPECAVAVSEPDCMLFCGCGWCNGTGSASGCLVSATGVAQCEGPQWTRSMSAPHCATKFGRLTDQCARYNYLTRLFLLLLFAPVFLMLIVGIGYAGWVMWGGRRAPASRFRVPF